MKQKHFLVKYNKDWVDLETGIMFEPLDISYDDAKEGLCNKMGRLVLKFHDGSPHPLIMIAKEPLKPEIKLKPVTVDMHDNNKRRIKYTFHPLAVIEVLKGLEKDENERQLAIRVGCSREAVENLINVIESRGLDLEKILGGEEDGRNNTKRGDDNTTGLSYHMRY